VLRRRKKTSPTKRGIDAAIRMGKTRKGEPARNRESGWTQGGDKSGSIWGDLTVKKDQEMPRREGEITRGVGKRSRRAEKNSRKRKGSVRGKRILLFFGN